MDNTGYFKGRRVTIIGLGRSGLACANLLFDLGAEVSVTEYNDSELIRANSLNLKSNQIKLELGRHSQEFIKDRDLIVVSPGVPGDSSPINWARQFNITMVSEIEVASILCPVPIIAITGTNGKTTVTTLIGKILEESRDRVFVCGNIGVPFCGEVAKIKKGDFVSLEVSSFQLERIQTFKPKIAVILNFGRNHLDRHRDMKEYLEAKKRIFINQDKSDYLVLNFDDPMVRDLAKDAKANIVYFSKKDLDMNPNQEAVLAVGSILGVDRNLILRVFKEFKGVQHRLEQIVEINNVKFINDSKSTTVDSTVWALNNIKSPIILIAGGRDKGNDYSVISKLMDEKVKEVILIGEARNKMRQAWGGILSVNEASSLKEAVRIAFTKAESGDCILLSPMCASFDMFSSYEERGRVFKEAVYELATQK